MRQTEILPMKMEQAQEVATHVASINWIDQKLARLDEQDKYGHRDFGWFINGDERAVAYPSRERAAAIRTILREHLLDCRAEAENALRDLHVDS